MPSRDQQWLLDAIVQMGGRLCGYNTPETWLTGRCDCKYGLHENWPRGFDEQTGCCELRAAYQALLAPTVSFQVEADGGAVALTPNEIEHCRERIPGATRDKLLTISRALLSHIDFAGLHGAKPAKQPVDTKREADDPWVRTAAEEIDRDLKVGLSVEDIEGIISDHAPLAGSKHWAVPDAEREAGEVVERLARRLFIYRYRRDPEPLPIDTWDEQFGALRDSFRAEARGLLAPESEALAVDPGSAPTTESEGR